MAESLLPFAGKKALLIEDRDPGFYKSQLESLGFEVFEYHALPDIIRDLESGKIPKVDIIISDNHMYYDIDSTQNEFGDKEVEHQEMVEWFATDAWRNPENPNADVPIIIFTDTRTVASRIYEAIHHGYCGFLHKGRDSDKDYMLFKKGPVQQTIQACIAYKPQKGLIVTDAMKEVLDIDGHDDLREDELEKVRKSVIVPSQIVQVEHSQKSTSIPEQGKH